MEYAIVKDRVVVTRIVAKSKKIAEKIASDMGGSVVSDDNAQVGYKKVSGKWVDQRPKRPPSPAGVTLDKVVSVLVEKGLIQPAELNE